MTLARVAAAVAWYEAERKEYPKQLADLVPKYLPKVPDDPYTGLPLRYRVENGGATVYVLGGDRKDDGGRAIPEGDGMDADGDVVWSVKRRP